MLIERSAWARSIGSVSDAAFAAKQTLRSLLRTRIGPKGRVGGTRRGRAPSSSREEQAPPLASLAVEQLRRLLLSQDRAELLQPVAPRNAPARVEGAQVVLHLLEMCSLEM